MDKYDFYFTIAVIFFIILIVKFLEYIWFKPTTVIIKPYNAIKFADIEDLGKSCIPTQFN